MTADKLEALAAEVKTLSDSLAKGASAPLSSPLAARIRRTLTEAYEKLRQAVEDLDPVKPPEFVFDPSNPNIIGRFIGITLIAQPRRPVAAVRRFYGSGVYAIYYTGGFHTYAAISKREHPIYVGKADPATAAGKTAFEQGDRLSNRLNDHRKNISKATGTLRLDDFEYRALVVQSGWQDAAERYLIHLFKPVWNSEVGICYGFGKHGDDPTTRANLRSPWDTLHPGRDWAHRDPTMKDAKPRAQIVSQIKKHLKENPPLGSIDEILHRFLEEMRTLS
jgi:Eco29kI restriction endonuclease